MKRTGLRSPWMTRIECKYLNPLAAPASFKQVCQGLSVEVGEGLDLLGEGG